MQRIKEYIEVCREVWKREKPLAYDGQTVHVPLPAGEGTGLGKPLKIINRPLRADIPVWWASLKGLSVEATAELADGWLPVFFVPDKFEQVWGKALAKGKAKRAAHLKPLEISAGGLVAIDESLVGDAKDKVLDMARPNVALYVGGMGARGKNFYNDICREYGYEREATEVQDLYLAGKKDEAARAVPREMLELTNLVGPAGYVKERIAAFRAAGVTMLSVSPVGANATQTLSTLRSLIDA
jgi:F420-dependent oxidoreductase-like protein